MRNVTIRTSDAFAAMIVKFLISPAVIKAQENPVFFLALRITYKA
jgi:hypothetical protein